MPFAFGCPECGAKLKTAAAPPTDRALQCPKCKHTFTRNDTDVREIATAEGTSTNGLPNGSGKTQSSETSSPRRDGQSTRSTRRVDDDEVAPRSRRRTDDDGDRSNRFDEDGGRLRRHRDEDDEPVTRRRDDVRSRRRDDDDEDAPRSRRREEDDDLPRRPRRDDDAPRARRRDDADDAPRARRREENNDDEDDRPRRRSRDRDADVYDRRPRRRPKRSNNFAMVGVVALGFLLVGGLAALAIWLLSGGSGYDKEMLAYLPKNTVGVFGMDVESIMKLENTAENLSEPQVKMMLDQMRQKTGLTVDQIQRVVIGMTEFRKNQPPDLVIVARFKSNVDKEKIISAINGQKKEKNGQVYYLTNDNACAAFPTSEILVIASKEAVLTDAVLTGDGTLRYSEELQEMCKPISKNQIWGSILIADEFRKEMVIPGEVRKQAAGAMSQLGTIIDFLPKARGFGFYFHNDGSHFKLGLGMKLTDSAEAEKLSEAAKEVVMAIDQLVALAALKGLNIPQDVREYITSTAKNTKAQQHGDAGYVVISFDAKEGKRLSDKYKNELNAMNGAPMAPMPPMQMPNPGQRRPPFNK